MTKTRQDKSAKPAAVELRDDALDQAAGGVITANAGGGPRVAGGEMVHRPRPGRRGLGGHVESQDQQGQGGRQWD